MLYLLQAIAKKAAQAWGHASAAVLHKGANKPDGGDTVGGGDEPREDSITGSANLDSEGGSDGGSSSGQGSDRHRHRGGDGSVSENLDEAMVQDTGHTTDYRRGTRYKKLSRMLAGASVSDLL